MKILTKQIVWTMKCELPKAILLWAFRNRMLLESNRETAGDHDSENLEDSVEFKYIRAP